MAENHEAKLMAYVLIALVILTVAASFLSVASRRGSGGSDTEVERSPYHYFQDEKTGTCFMEICIAPNSCNSGTMTYVPCTEAVLRQIAAEKKQ